MKGAYAGCADLESVMLAVHHVRLRFSDSASPPGLDSLACAVKPL